MTTIYNFTAAYTKLGIGTVPSSAPTITIVDSSGNLLVNAGVTTARANMLEVFDYSYSGADGLDLVGKFHTTDLTVDSSDLYSSPSFECTSLGTGSIVVTINITELGVPQDGVEVWVTTDLAGTNVVASGVTDVFGNLVVALDSGNYYVWKQKAGINFTNPQLMVV